MIRVAILTSLLLGVAQSGSAAADPEVLLQLADYVAVDYREAVRNGVVVNAAEYREMREFGARIVRLTEELEADGPLLESARRLQNLIGTKAPVEEITAASRAFRERLLAEHPVAVTPPGPPDLALGAELYGQMCATCHGVEGGGNGPRASGLQPPPTDFQDPARAAERSLYGLYNTITLGVEGTAMTSFAQLPDADRWALAFHVGSLAATDADLATGERLLAAGEDATILDPRTVVSSTPGEIGRRFGGDTAALALYLRRHPDALFSARAAPLEVAREKVERTVAAFRDGDRAAAEKAALSAYLDGFELAESSLSAVDARLMRRIESDMLALREAVGRDDTSVEEVERRAATVLEGFDEARQRLDDVTLTPAVVFGSAVVILLREGLEAILILAAIGAFMIKTGRRDALKYVHAGWIGALALGVGTWGVSTWLLEISGATRELTEGLTALFAAVVLFYVGFWMHSKVSGERWTRFLKEHVGQALERGTLWTLALVSFTAVYREVFETVLFYQALWAQTAGTGQAMILGGAGAAAVLLVLAAWMIFQAGVRLPLRQFFGVSAAVMIVLSVIFAGKGIAAMQEAGRLPSSRIAAIPRIDPLGIYPNWESVGAQAAIMAMAVMMVLYHRRRGARSAD